MSTLLENQPPSMPTSTEPSNSSADSLATPKTQSQQPLRRSNQTSPLLTPPEYQHRILITGMNGSGKSQLALSLFLTTAAPRLIIDPADSSLCASACGSTREDIAAATFRDPRRIPDVATARFVPRDPMDKDAYDDLYEWMFNHYPRYVWLDESSNATPANGYSRWTNTYVVQGRKRSLGHMACSTRPRNLMSSLLTEAQHAYVFMLPKVEDRKYVADNVGIEFAVLEEEMQKLPEFGFLWFNVKRRTLAVCNPLKV